MNAHIHTLTYTYTCTHVYLQTYTHVHSPAYMCIHPQTKQVWVCHPDWLWGPISCYPVGSRCEQYQFCDLNRWLLRGTKCYGIKNVKALWFRWGICYSTSWRWMRKQACLDEVNGSLEEWAYLLQKSEQMINPPLCVEAGNPPDVQQAVRTQGTGWNGNMQ